MDEKKKMRREINRLKKQIAELKNQIDNIIKYLTR